MFAIQEWWSACRSTGANIPLAWPYRVSQRVRPRRRSAVEYPCTMGVTVQFRDLDAFQHVNNATYFSYFEMARIAYYEAISGRQVTLDDIRIILVDAACRYRSPALLGEQLAIGIRVSHM